VKWQKTGNRRWEAVGKDGTFIIEQSGKTFWSKFSSRVMAFKMPPRWKLSEAKKLCEDNHYWEA
jgi:hypothetical protein